ncbi:MAG: septal ring lytic transglycosylase RlpA family protein [Arachidicoccus sp.]|nr:septal ring lytic transglycosylase RlpA family protein [Arachidicoccus sp.]
MKLKVINLIICILFAAGDLHAQAVNKSVEIKHTDSSKIVVGKASFYSKSLEGTKTATGKTFSNKKFTAASNFFKLGTWVRVTRIATGESIMVYINDRMHPSMAKKGRVIDLSIAAAEKLQFLVSGITKVVVESIEKY